MLLLLPLLFLPTPVLSDCHILKHGLSSDLILHGTLLTPTGAHPSSTIYIHSHTISHDPCPHSPDATILNCTNSVISPGFINTHEHIDYATVSPFPDTGERVFQRHDWRLGLRGFTARVATPNGSEIAATAWGELRHLLSGTTAIIGSEMVPGLVRNLDYTDGLEDGVSGPVAKYDVFPLDDAAGIQRLGDCDYGPAPITREVVAAYNRYVGHIAEGIDEEAANEFACLSNGTFDTVPAPGGGGLSTDIVGPNLALVHALGLTEADIRTVAAGGAKIVWSPRSNVFLYGRTMNVSALLEAGITVALGTDWLPSGSATMGREAVCAKSVMSDAYGVEMSAKTLWEMATINAAKVAGFEDMLGSIEEGKVADIVVFGENDEHDADPYAQAIFAPQEKIELVIRGGKVLLADSAIADVARGKCEEVVFGETTKMVCVEDELGSSYADFERELGGVYPAVLPAVPPDEPSCAPTRYDVV